MVDSKYNKVLTVILVIVIIAILIILGIWGFTAIRNRLHTKETNSVMEEFDNTTVIRKSNVVGTTNESGDFDMSNLIGDTNTTAGSSSGKTAKVTYKGFTVAGKIEIPSINLAYPVLDRATKTSMEASVAIAYGPGLNQVGNTVIMGHNYRNGTFFSNLQKVQIGDAVYITDESGTRLKYTIYNTYTTSPDDFDYATRDTQGAKEISLQTCTDDVKMRFIVWAKADE